MAAQLAASLKAKGYERTPGRVFIQSFFKEALLRMRQLAPRYPRWADFQAVRAELDPHGRFASPWVRHMLGGCAP